MVYPFKCSYVNDLTETENRFGSSPESAVFTFVMDFSFYLLFLVLIMM